MANTPPSTNQIPNKGKSKLEEAPHPSRGGPSSTTNTKGKEIIVVDDEPPPPNPNKRKAIVLGGCVHYPRVRNDHAKNNPITIDDEVDGAEKSVETRGTIDITKLISGVNDVPQLYVCEFCSKRFSSPQALGGHQNGHKIERQIKNEVEAKNKANNPATTTTLPSSGPVNRAYGPVNRAYGPSLNPMTMNTTQHLLNRYNTHNTNINNPIMMGNGSYHRQNVGVPLNGTFQQHGAATLPFAGASSSSAVARAGSNTVASFYPFNYGTGRSNFVGNNATNHLNYPRYENGYAPASAGYGSYGTGHGGYPIHYNNPEFASGYYRGNTGAGYYGYYNGGGSAGGAGYYGGGSQNHPDLVWVHNGAVPSTGYYGGVAVDNNSSNSNSNNAAYGLYNGQVVDAVAYDPTTQLMMRSVTGMNWNDYRRYQNITGWTTHQPQVPMVAAGTHFGSAPQGGDHGGDGRRIADKEGEEEEIDLTLKL